MSTDNQDPRKSAKMTTFETVIAKLKSEASREVVSTQEINQAIGQAVLLWLPTLDEKALTVFFAGIEVAGGAVLARKIERHALRPAAVAPIVKAARTEAEAQKEAKKADAARAKEDREKELLAKLMAKHGPVSPEKVSEAAD